MTPVPDTPAETITPCAHYLVRFGIMGTIDRFRASEVDLQRDTPVVVRTSRGVELGQVLIRDDRRPADITESDIGLIVRAALASDLIAAEQHAHARHQLFAACETRAAAEGWPIVLLDAELTLDHTCILHYISAQPFEVRLPPFIEFAGRRHSLHFNQNGKLHDLAESETEPAGCRDGHCDSCSTGAGGGGHCQGCAVADVVRARRAVPVAV